MNLVKKRSAEGMEVVQIEFEEGNEMMPSRLKVRFAPIPWLFSYAHARSDSRFNSPTTRKLEARRAIRAFCLSFEKELMNALPEDLKD